MRRLNESMIETGFFTMADVREVESKSDLESAKQFALGVVGTKTALVENSRKAERMISGARSKTHLMQGMCNFMLAHGGMKI